MKRLMFLTALLVVPVALHATRRMASSCDDLCPVAATPVAVSVEEPPDPPSPPEVPRRPRWREARAVATRAIDPSQVRVVRSELSATPERARASLQQQLARAVSEWIAEAGVPRAWAPPDRLVAELVLGPPAIEPIEREYGQHGLVFQAATQVDFSPRNRARLVATYHRQVAGQRLAVLGGILLFVLTCLAALAGYIRADEATKGYYTNHLRLAAAAGVGGAGVALYHLLT